MKYFLLWCCACIYVCRFFVFCFFTYVLLNTVRVHITFITNSKHVEQGNLSLLLFISLDSNEAGVYSAQSLRLCMYMRKKKWFPNNF